MAGLLLCSSVSGKSVKESGKSVNFSFNDVGVRTFVELVGGMTGKKFVVAGDIEGSITVISPRITQKEIYPLFVRILESSGYSVLEDGDLFRVVKLQGRDVPSAPVIGVDEVMPASGLVTKIIRLEHVSSASIKKVLDSSFTGKKSSSISSLDDTNHIIVTDTIGNIAKIEKIIAQVDASGLTRQTEVVALRYAGAEQLASELSIAMAKDDSEADIIRRRIPSNRSRNQISRSVSVVASPHSNSLILIGSATEIQELKSLVAKMDVDTPAGGGRLNAIFLKYIPAKEAAVSIAALLEKSNTQVQAGRTSGQVPGRGRISIQASESSNALLVDAGPSDYEAVRKLIDQLDKLPDQVHISVVIAEHSISDGLDFGVEMAAVEMPDAIGSSAIQGSSTLSGGGVDGMMSMIQKSVFPNGLTVGVAHGRRLDGDGNLVSDFPGLINIEAIKKDSRVEILSETSLEAQNNKEASVSIVSDIPMLKSTIEGGSGSSRDVIQNIERTEVGIKLKLTPYIVPGREVQMVLNPRIEAIVDSGPSGSLFAPTIARREVHTTVTVKDGNTIVIAGLTRKDSKKVVKKVPLLGSIPIIGWLFKSTTDVTEKTNLLIFVTPHIVAGPGDAQKVRSIWEKKTGLSLDE